RQTAVIFDKVLLIAFLVGVGQFVIGDAFLKKLGLDFVVVVGYQHMVLVHCGFIVVGVGRDIMWHLKKVIGIAVNVCLWGCCQSDQHCVKVFKDGAVLFKDAAVALINDNQVKVSRREQPLSFHRLGVIDGVE